QAYRADPYAAQAYEQQWTIFRPPAYGSTGLASGQLCANSYLGYHYPLKQASSTRSLADALAAMHEQYVVSSRRVPEFATDIYIQGIISRLEKKRRKAQREEISKWKLVGWLALLLLIVIGVIIILMLAISKMHSASSISFRSLRQYNGRFLITEGPLLKFDGQLLQSNTEQFVAHANKIQRELNRIFQHSDVSANYAGSEVTQFRFEPAIPALDVSFNVRMRPNFGDDALDLLTTLRSYVRARGFDGNTVDVHSISLENKRFSR
uniref:SEA domain-containing protein n=1 Tax=Parascaris univalens TaxID=6257 RepID=A0A914ZTH2_PARUN